MASPLNIPEVLAANAGSGSVVFRAGEAIAKYDIIYFSSLDDDHPIVRKASAAAIATCQSSLWVSTETIPVGQYGVARSRVLAQDIDTTGAAAQAPVYLSDTPGGISFTPGTNKVQVGEVVISSSSGDVLLIPMAFGGVIAVAPNIVDVDNVTIEYNGALALQVKEGGLDGTHLDPLAIGDGLVVTGIVLSVDLASPSGLEFDSGDLRIALGTGLEFNGNTLQADLGDGLTFNLNEIVPNLGNGLTISASQIVPSLSAGLKISGSQIQTDIGDGLTYNLNAMEVALGNGLTFDAGSIVPNLGTGLVLAGSTISADLGAGLEFNGNQIQADLGTGLIFAGNAITVAPWMMGIQPEHEVVVSDTVYVRSAGNDVTGDGSVLFPFATVRRAMHEIAQYPVGNPTIDIGAGTFAVDGYWPGNGVSWQGNVTLGTLATVVSASASDSIGVIASVTGLLVAEDDLRQTRVVFASGTLNGTYGVIHKNTTTALGETSLYIVLARNVVVGPSPGDTLNLVTNTTFLSGSPTFAARDQVIQNCCFTGASSDYVTVADGASVSLFYCSLISIAGFTQTGGYTYMTGLAYGAVGSSANSFLKTKGGRLTIGGGNFFDGGGSGSNNQIQFVNSHVEFTGLSALAETNGVAFEGCVITQPFNSGSSNGLLFEDFNITNDQGVLVDALFTGASTCGYLPALYGEINGPYSIVASNGAYVRSLNSTLNCSNGSMVCSADGGANESYHADDLTAIVIGSDVTLYRRLPAGYVNGGRLTWNSGALKTVTFSAVKTRSDDDLMDIIKTSSTTVNLAVNGVGGLDSGTVQNTTAYSIWAISTGNGATVDGLASASFGAPTMPSGYTHKSLIGYVYTNGSANINEFVMSGNGKEVDVFFPGGIVTGSATNAETSITITGIAPGGVVRSPMIFVSVRNAVAVAGQYARILKATGGTEWYNTQANTSQIISGWMERNTTTVVVKSTSASLTAVAAVHGTKFIRGAL